MQEALLSLPKDEKFEASNQATKPAGGYYALIRAGTMQITTSVITMGRTPLFEMLNSGAILVEKMNGWRNNILIF
ncbi:hypothetical protein HORIV_72640 [Vreelandella olivaria]|uniref:Uncharacterized protein n=1 Tax=Vreelandella olivaria TaxID=390919 RepID=A0ABM7GVQ3_9GAMM|nr:hypothetical protein HORIV_72640 [Halomonas olivaria]